MPPFADCLAKSNIIYCLDWQFIAALVIPSIIVILGWIYGNWSNNQRDVISRKRESRLKGIEAAYLRLATISNRELTDKARAELELFVAEIQLYGTPKQVSLMEEIVEGFTNPKPPPDNMVSFDAILIDLRDTLRMELNLEPLSGPVWWLRLQDQNAENVHKTKKTKRESI